MWRLRFIRFIACFVLLVFAFGFVAGCGGDSAPQQSKKVKKGKASKKGKGVIEKKSTLARGPAKSDWRYDPTGKHDPYVVPPRPPGSQNGDIKYDIDQMSLMGIIRGSGLDAGYVRFPDGTDKVVRLGDTLGKHGGEVKEIGKDYILVEERYMDPNRPNETFIIEKQLSLIKIIKKK